MRYRIYANNLVWKQVDIKPTLEEALKILDNLIANGIEEYIVVESSLENGDIPIITNFKSYERYKTKRLDLRV